MEKKPQSNPAYTKYACQMLNVYLSVSTPAGEQPEEEEHTS
jgi:hypothetical protein